MRVRKRTIAIATLSLLAGLVLAVVALLHTDFVRRIILDQASAALAQQGVRFEGRELRLDLWHLRLSLRGITVAATHAPELPALLTIDRVDADLDAFDLLRGRYNIESASIVSPRLHLVLLADGSNNLPKLPESESKSPTNYRIHNLTLSGGSATIEDRATPFTATLPALSASLDFSTLAQRYRAALSIPAAQLKISGRDLSIEGIEAALGLSPDFDAARIDSFRAASSLGRIEASGDVATEKIDATVKLTALLQPAAQWAGQSLAITGSLNADVRITGATPQPRVQASIASADVTLQPLGAIQTTATLAYNAAEPQLIGITGLDVQSRAATLRLNGSLSLDRARPSRLHLNSTSNLAPALALVTTRVPIDSQAALTADFRFPGLDYEKLSGNARLMLRAGQETDAVPLTGDASLNATNGLLHTTIHALQLPGVLTKGDLQLASFSKLDGRIAIDVNDAAAATQAIAKLSALKKEQVPDVRGTLYSSIALSGTLREPQAALHLDQATLDAGQIKSLAASGEFLVDAHHLAIRRLNVSAAGQQASIEGTAGFTAPNDTLDLRASVERADIAALLSLFPQQKLPVSGRLSATASITGTRRQAQGKFALNVTSLTAWSERLGSLRANATLGEGRLNVTEILLQKDRGSLRASGQYNLDPRTFTATATLTRFAIEQLQPAAGQRIAALLNGKASLHGAIDNPAGDFSLSIPQLLYNGNSTGPIDLSGSLANHQLKASTRIPELRIQASATIPTTAEAFRTEFQAVFDNTPLHTLATLAGQPDTGIEGHFSGNASGTLTDALATSEANAAISALDAEWKTLPLRLSNPLQLTLRGGLATIPSTRIQFGQSNLELAGAIPVDADAAIPGVTASGSIHLADIPIIVPEHVLKAGGGLEIAATIRGSLHKPLFDATFRLANGSLQSNSVRMPLTGINLDARLANEILHLSTLEAAIGEGKVRAQGAVPLHLFLPPQYLSLPERDSARLSLTAEQLPVEAIPGVPPELRGAFSVQVTATAPKAELDALQASIELPSAKLRLSGFDIELARPATATLEKSLLQLHQLELKGPETQLRTVGYVRAAPPYAANLSTSGNLDIALLSAWLEDWSLSGPSNFRFAVRGSLSEPTLAGFIELKDGIAAKATPSIEASSIQARISFDHTRITLEQLKGALNGGNFDAQGGLAVVFGSKQNFEARDLDLRLNASNVFFEPFTGLKTIAGATLRVEGGSSGLTISGDVAAEESTFDEPISFEQALFDAFRSSSVTTLEESAAAIPIHLDINLRTLAPLEINNNLLRAAIEADLRVRGTTSRPGLTGRLNIDEGGELYLNERTYTVERGVVTFTDERRIAPTLDIAARTRVNEYDVTLRAQGPPGRDLQTTLVSDPPLPEPDVLALLATGRRLEELEGAESAVLREQVLSYLAGSVGGGITSRAGRAIGLSQVRIEPSLIASETEPTARLTLGQDFTRQLGLVYSMNLRDSSDQIWIGKYDITRRFTTRAIRQSDETYRFQFQHDLQFGGRKPETSSQKKRITKRIAKITVTGSTPFSEKDITGWLKLHAGDKYDFFKLRKGMDRIREKHTGKGYLEVRVSNTREERETEVDLAIDVKAGPLVDFAYEGWDPSRSERKAIRDAWRGGAFDALRLRAAERAALRQLSSEGYLQAEINVTPRVQQDRKLVLLEVARGLRYRTRDVRFLGVPPEREHALRRIVEQDDLAYTDPARAAALVRDHFFRQGFLDTEAKPPTFSYNESAQAALATFHITLGPQYRIGEIAFHGASVIPSNHLRARLPVLSGSVYTPELDSKTIDALFQAYGDVGYTDAQIEQRLRRDPFTGLLNIDYTVEEGAQRVVTGLEIAGNQYTSKNLIRTQIDIKPGEILYDGRVAEARRNLYSTGAFTIADVEIEPLAQQPDPAKKLVRLNAKVQEVRPFEIRYGAFYDTERGAGGIVDITNRNMLGGARSVGFRTRYDSTLREARAYYDQPNLLRFPVKTTATLFARREDNEAFLTDRVGFTINGQYRFWNHYRADFGYRLEQTHSFDREPDPLFPFDVRLRIAPLTTALSRDTRDDILDATRGTFTSHAFEFAPSTLGSQLRYVKYYGQYFLYKSFGGTREVPWAGTIHPRFTYAGGARLGLATGLGGQTVIQSERFFAGGANTVRGFDRNFLGPLDFMGEPLGGNAVAIVNQELRFPIYKMFDGVTFFDAGNVSRLVSNFSNEEWRKSAGFGLRLRTPFVLLRVDYGFKLGRRPGESAGQFFFSIGQAF